MGQIVLKEMEFYAFHGWYEAERKLGGRYITDVSVTTDFSGAAHADDLNETVNYEVMYALIAEIMSTPSPLLESLVTKILDALFEKFPAISTAEVKIRKPNPPLSGLCQFAEVSLSRSR